MTGQGQLKQTQDQIQHQPGREQFETVVLYWRN